MPRLRHYFYWIAACAFTPVALAQLSDYFAAIDFEPRYLFVPPLSLHNILIDVITIALCLIAPLLQWQALRGIKADLKLWQWLPLAWGAIGLHTLLFLITNLKHVHVQIDGRQLAEVLTAPQYSIASAFRPLRLALSLILSAGLYALFQAVCPALLLARQSLQRRHLIMAALAGSLACLLAQWLQTASGTCLFASPGGIGMLQNTPFAILVLSRAAIGALEGAAGVATLAWLMQRNGADANLKANLKWPRWILLAAILLNLLLQPALALFARDIGLDGMLC